MTDHRAEKVEQKTAWLIERGQPEHQRPTIWWAGDRDWTDDANQAVRFARKRDAEHVEWRNQLHGHASEHVWVVSPETVVSLPPRPGEQIGGAGDGFEPARDLGVGGDFDGGIGSAGSPRPENRTNQQLVHNPEEKSTSSASPAPAEEGEREELIALANFLDERASRSEKADYRGIAERERQKRDAITFRRIAALLRVPNDSRSPSPPGEATNEP